MGAGAARAHGARARAQPVPLSLARNGQDFVGAAPDFLYYGVPTIFEPDAVERADGRRHAAARRRRRPPRRLRLRMPLRSVRRHGRRCRRRRRRRLCRRRRRADPPRARAQYECERALRLLRDARGGGGRCAAHRGVAQRARRVELHGGVHLLPAAPSRRALAEFGPRRRRHRRRARRSQLQRARVAARLPLRRLGGAARLRLAERAPARVRPRWPARRARRRARRRRRRGARPRAERGGRHCRQRDARALHVAAAVEWRVRRGRRLRRRGGGPFVGTTPPAPPATVALELSLNGHDFTAAAVNFTYYAAAPSISRIWPRSDTAAGGRAVTVHGAGLGGGSHYLCRFGQEPLLAASAAPLDDRRVVCPTPPLSPRASRRAAAAAPSRMAASVASSARSRWRCHSRSRSMASSTRRTPPTALSSRERRRCRSALARPPGPSAAAPTSSSRVSVSRTARGTSAPLARRAARRAPPAARAPPRVRRWSTRRSTRRRAACAARRRRTRRARST